MTTIPDITPADTYNLRLIERVHPADWHNPKPADCYNLVVIGGGTAGLVSAAGAVGLGARVALIERAYLGGDCLNYGCVPSKALIAPARIAGEINRSANLGIRIDGGAAVDFPAIMERLRKIRADISANDSAERFKNLGVDIFFGEGKFISGDRVEINGAVLKFKKAVIAAGARAIVPKIKGLAEAGFLTNESIFNLTTLPRRLVIIGGGPIGCELAQAFARLGSEVTIIVRSNRFLPREEQKAADILADSFRADGVKILLNSTVEEVGPSSGAQTLRVKSDSGEINLEVDRILVGTGRRPNIEGLGLEAAGVDAGPEGVIVDDRLRTTNRRIYAAGDICSSYKFTHAADAGARIVIQNALFFGRRKASELVIPWCTYTDPEIARVGYNIDAATAAGIEFDRYLVELSDVDRAITDGVGAGYVSIMVKKGSDRIIGATIVAPAAGEMINEITQAMQNGIGLGKIGATIHPYPTTAEAIKKAADSYNRTRLTPLVARIFKRFFELAR